MSTLFARARAYQPLSPTERAVLKLVEGIGCVALVAALPVVAEALGHQNVNWSDVAHTALAAASVAVLLALAKYAKAQGDPLLADALGSVATGFSRVAGLSDPDGAPTLLPAVADVPAPVPLAPISSAAAPAASGPASPAHMDAGSGT